jgi:hypothetical protein
MGEPLADSDLGWTQPDGLLGLFAVKLSVHVDDKKKFSQTLQRRSEFFPIGESGSAESLSVPCLGDRSPS